MFDISHLKWKQDFLSIMLYKVYMTSGRGSYVTRAAQSYIYMSLEWSMPNSIAFDLLVQKKIFKKGPHFGGGAICDPRDFIWTRMFHANLKSILASGSREEDFLNYLLYIHVYKPIPAMSPWTIHLGRCLREK